jgi:hypothetical protein
MKLNLIQKRSNSNENVMLVFAVGNKIKRKNKTFNTHANCIIILFYIPLGLSMFFDCPRRRRIFYLPPNKVMNFTK